MHYLFLLLLWTTSLFALETSLQSFDAQFEQRITDENNKSVVYTGHVWASRPDQVLWHYTEPVEKSIYIAQNTVIIIEPELEQAIIRTLNEDIDLLTILSRAKKISDCSYETSYHSQRFLIELDNEVLHAIHYKDSFDNRITLTFSHQQQNIPIAPQKFHPTIPTDYDIIR